MATQLPLTTALAIIPSLPRPLLNRLVERAIDHMDALDGDRALEDDDPAEDEHDKEPPLGWSAFSG
jgi:hypothetical protein